MNVLAAEATAPWLLFLNPDAEVLSFPWPDQPSLPAGSLIGAEQFDSRGRPVRAYGRRYRVVDEMLRSWLRRVPEPREGTGFVGGAGLLIERQRFSTLGGFDERYFLFYEDVDLCLRAQAAGLPVRLERRFRIRHDTGSSARRNWDAALGHSYRSGRIFHEVYGHSLRGYDAFVAADAGARAVLWRTRGDRRRSRAYRHLAGRAAAALLSRHNTPAEAPAGWPT